MGAPGRKNPVPHENELKKERPYGALFFPRREERPWVALLPEVTLIRVALFPEVAFFRVALYSEVEKSHFRSKNTTKMNGIKSDLKCAQQNPHQNGPKKERP